MRWNNIARAAAGFTGGVPSLRPVQGTCQAVTIRAVTSTLAALKSGNPAVIQVERDGRLMYVTLELE